MNKEGLFGRLPQELHQFIQSYEVVSNTPHGEGLPAHELVHLSIMHCDKDLQSDFFRNVILHGGGSMFPHLNDRMQKELVNMVPGHKIGIVALPDRCYLTWVGGSKLSVHGNWENMVITSEQYNEFGPSIIHMKTF